ncbi:hypothetical protein MTR67_005786 [Solanum verrucosum]|uniref:Uncharacterized protein n=1 Tax=Solanum verrucosum TaxID=315347 RepID=A0AAF0Q1K5_SOLVR|nr:hypothetical protein MTR67_005786 [Solanum verrucosum]
MAQASKEPCKKQACDIQACLSKNNFLPQRCVKVIEALKYCFGFRLQITPYPGCVLRGSQTSCDFMDVLNAIKKAGSLLK